MAPTSSIHDSAEDSTVAATPDACPVVRAVEQVGVRWRLLVLHDLQNDVTPGGEKRFNELERSTDASSRTRSRVLDDLGEAGLVDRRVEERPLATYDSMSEKGCALCPVFAELERWADEWLDRDE